jgi:hypothetical protein
MTGTVSGDMADLYSGHKLGLLIRHMGSQKAISRSLFPAFPIKPALALNCKVFQSAFESQRRK